MKMRYSALAGAVLLAATIVVPAATAGTIVVTDPVTACSFVSPWAEISTFTWDGACKDGGIEGEGHLELFAGPYLFWVYDLSDAHGAIAAQGVLIPRIGDRDLFMKRGRCAQTTDAGRFALVDVFVDPDLDLSNEIVRDEILKRTDKAVDAMCTKALGAGAETISVDFAYDRDHRPKNGGSGFEARRTSEGWKQSDLDDARRVQNIVDEHNTPIRRRIAADKAAAEAAERAAKKAAEMAVAEAKERERLAKSREAFEAFARERGVSRLVLDNSIHANPFAYAGAPVAVVAHFSEMVTADTALFTVNGDPAYVSSVPSSAFLGGETVLLAITDLAKVKVDLPPFGETLILGARMLGFETCADRECGTFTDWQRQR